VARDVSWFDRFARPYDWLMPGTDVEALRAGLSMAERDVDRVLDVGGGSGRATRIIEGPQRIVVDAATGMLRRARQHGLEGIRADAGHLPMRDDTVDAVLVVDALHHIPDQVGALEEAARILRPGGVLVVREFDRATLPGRLLVGAEHAVGFDSSFFTPDELAGAVDRAGLDAAVPDRGFGFTVVGVRR
jgi:demethylmenaquinone methyltransferase/2-methoxy-6-polyprenyl-1,4-benzoquinol methylase